MDSAIILLDGAGGTELWKLAAEQGIPKVPVWKYNMEHPELVAQVAKHYLEAGSRIILANTFGANGPAVARSSGYSVAQVVSAGVGIAKAAAAGTGAKVALDVGPLMELMEPYGDLTEEEAAHIFREQMAPGVEAGANLIMLETFLDLEMMRVAAEVAVGFGLPVLCTMTFEAHGRTMMGNRVEDIAGTLEEVGVTAVGLNCSLGPVEAIPIMEKFAAATKLPLVFKPNAGKPVVGEDGKEISPYSAADFAADVEPALDKVAYLGGCCGTDPDYIRALNEKLS